MAVLPKSQSSRLSGVVSAVQCCAVLCSAVQWCAVLCCAVQCSAMLCCALQCCAVQCSAVLCCTELCCAVLCCAELSCVAVLCCAGCTTFQHAFPSRSLHNKSPFHLSCLSSPTHDPHQSSGCVCPAQNRCGTFSKFSL